MLFLRVNCIVLLHVTRRQQGDERQAGVEMCIRDRGYYGITLKELQRREKGVNAASEEGKKAWATKTIDDTPGETCVAEFSFVNGRLTDIYYVYRYENENRDKYEKKFLELYNRLLEIDDDPYIGHATTDPNFNNKGLSENFLKEYEERSNGEMVRMVLHAGGFAGEFNGKEENRPAVTKLDRGFVIGFDGQSYFHIGGTGVIDVAVGVESYTDYEDPTDR